jgi:hypothetical protein
MVLDYIIFLQMVDGMESEAYPVRYASLFS